MTEVHQLQFSSYTCSSCTFSEKYFFQLFWDFIVLHFLSLPLKPEYAHTTCLEFLYDVVEKEAEVQAVHLVLPLDPESSPPASH